MKLVLILLAFALSPSAADVAPLAQVPTSAIVTGSVREFRRLRGNSTNSTDSTESDADKKADTASKKKSKQIVNKLLWASVAIGGLLGLFMVFSGSGKVVSCHPMYKPMNIGFDKIFGPWFGIDGDALRFFIGLTELLAGLCLVTGVVLSALPALGKDVLGDKDALVQTLILCDFVGLAALCMGGVIMHLKCEGKPGMIALPWLMAAVGAGLLIAMMVITGISRTNLILVIAFSVISILALIMSLVMHQVKGKGSDDMQIKLGFNLMNAAMSQGSAYAPMSQQ